MPVEENQTEIKQCSEVLSDALQAGNYIKTETVNMIPATSESGKSKSSHDMGYKDVGDLMSGSYSKDASFELFVESNEPKYEQD